MTTLHRQQGFTLVEVITVMVLLVALATITVQSTSQLAFDGRYQVTQDRYDKIKTAILGNPNQSINGHPSVSGFVADMGRLPNCLRELIDGSCTNNGVTTQIGHCSDGSGSNQPTCSLAGNKWNNWETVYPNAHCSDNISNQSSCVSPLVWWSNGICSDDTSNTESACTTNSGRWASFSSLVVGWRGGYIETTGDPANTNAFADGWGRPAQGHCSNSLYSTHDSCINASNLNVFNGYCNNTAYLNDYAGCIGANANWIDDNYGWYFNNNSNTEINLLSYGKDQVAGKTSNTYDADYPQNTQPIIASSVWQQLTPTTINITITPLVNFLATPIIRPAVEPDCSNNGGAFVDANTPKCAMPLEYTQISCPTVTGTWTPATGTVLGYCSMVAKLPITQSACTNASGVWSSVSSICSPSAYPTKSICLDLRYVNDGQIAQLTPIIPANNQIIENGMTQSATFTLPIGTNLSMGQAAFRIMDCSTPATYPTAIRDFKIVDIFPNRSLNFDW